MDIIVCLKQIVDLKQIRIKKETGEPVLEGLPLVFGDMDINALEEAVKIKEKSGGKVIALAMGSAKLKDTIKAALARGADEAVILIDPLFDAAGSQGKAAILAKAIKKIGKYDLILMGEGSTDNYSGQLGARLSQILGLPALSYTVQIEMAANSVKVTRNMEDCMEVAEAPLPAIIGVTSEINKPRIPSLMQILKASKKNLTEWKAADIGLSAAELGEKETVMLSNLAPPEQRKQVLFEGKTDDNIEKLIDSLMKEGVWGR